MIVMRQSATPVPGVSQNSSDPENEYRLPTHALRRTCSIEHFGFATTEELPHVRNIIGQPRGVRSLEFGLDIDTPGYNVFMLGPTGTGRETALRQFLERHAENGEVPHDWAYVYNFKAPHKPRALKLPPGAGAKLRDAMAELVGNLQHQIPLVLDSKEFRQEIDEMKRGLERQTADIMEKIFANAAEMGFAIVPTSARLAVVPAHNGQPMAPETFALLPEAQRKDMDERRYILEGQLEEATRAARAAEIEVVQSIQKLQANAVNTVLDLHFPKIRELCSSCERAQVWLDDMCLDIMDNLGAFTSERKDDVGATTQPLSKFGGLNKGDSTARVFLRYQVNLIVDHANSKHAPVILESLPTFRNLVGYIQSDVLQGGAMVADFTMIKPGALHQSSGGYLVLDAASVFKQPFAWEALKLSLKSKEVRIENPETQNGAIVLRPKFPEPEPIPISIKVVMLGTPQFYYFLQSADDEFLELFKVKADFAETMERNHENEDQYASFVAARCHEDHLPHFDSTGVAKIVEFGTWLAKDQGRLSTRFGVISDLVYEAAHWARNEGKTTVSSSEVELAIEERIYRTNLIEESLRNRILEGTLLIDTEGEFVGQVNGLTVFQLGDYTFGQPHRVTARAFLGNEGVINIEREVDMAGPIHNKGLLTLRGYLGGQYALEHPLSLTASLTFEQNYSGVEGDSASSTELYALLSALSGYAIRQDIAVTGSVNQFGHLQPIGGVTQKIEGFFDVCKARSLTGTQGVIIPTSNVRNLMLREEVVSAVEEGVFHVYAVENVDKGIEILTGIPAGKRNSDGTFPEGTVHHAVCTHLQDLAEHLEQFSVYGG